MRQAGTGGAGCAPVSRAERAALLERRHDPVHELLRSAGRDLGAGLTAAHLTAAHLTAAGCTRRRTAMTSRPVMKSRRS
ncbi:hypothetical protein D9753_28070 [Streptomyces dangxiongensis]|uniref:Uncharacterized protein n=1 Tax=Streptomyces dangxiongensis TaxID=1442032 RepID=A0A3G2JIH4_9ACTN|nr:hypothetical protein D9753_28070 [Streptomyces dangxiongensis]